MAPDRQWEQLSYHLNIPSFPTQLSSQPYNIFSESFPRSPTRGGAEHMLGSSSFEQRTLSSGHPFSVGFSPPLVGGFGALQPPVPMEIHKFLPAQPGRDAPEPWYGIAWM